ncbi:hypothetical protein BGP_0975 [Beggiatoa sp. PS]|nr:hypothetical protein BGP_0975 [Beggiatoa sp. PS]
MWFLWVYRQLEKLVAGSSNESIIVRTTAEMIERHLSGSKEQGVCGGKTPFKHVFSPVALVTTHSPKNESIIMHSLKELFDAIRRQRDYIIPEFRQLEELPKGNCIGFQKWVENLQAAYSYLETKIQEERALLFLPVLMEAIKMFANEQRPENIIPISAYLPTLQQYTDKDRTDIVALIREMKIYKRFSHLF